MTTGSDDRPLKDLPVAGAAPASTPPRHESVLPPESRDALDALALAVAAPDAEARLRDLLHSHPGLLEGWARLGECLLARGDAVGAYACARTGYHRGLDRLRRHGWGGVGLVRWREETNRGFLRSLRLLLVTAAALDETDEAERCRSFLLDLDPDDGLGAAGYPPVPDRTWTPPPPPP